VSDREKLGEVIKTVRQAVPSGGTSLANAFAAATKMQPKPDNIYLITDGLPTQGRTPGTGSTVSGAQRLRLFNEALKSLPHSSEQTAPQLYPTVSGLKFELAPKQDSAPETASGESKTVNPSEPPDPFASR